MTYTELQDFLWAWPNLVLNPEGDPPVPLAPTQIVPIIWGNENGPRPTRSYVSLTIITDRRVGQPNESLVRLTGTPPNEVGTQTLRWNKDLTLNVQTYGPRAHELIQALEESLALLVVQDMFGAAGLALRDIGDVKDISEALDEQTEPRKTMDLVFGRAVAVTQQPGWIETVDYSGTTE